MHPASGAQSFKGTLFYVWKGNRPCRIYVGEEQVHFIRRAVGINPGATAVIGSQFGLVGALAVGLAAKKASRSTEFVRDDDPTPPDQLMLKHADNHAVPVADIIDPRIEPAGKYMSYGPNSGRWHFTRRGEPKETVVLLQSPDDARVAVSLLGGAFGSRLRNNSGIVAPPAPSTRRADAGSGSDLVTRLPLPQGQAEIVQAMQALTELLGERAPGEWQKIRGDVRVVSSDRGRPLEVVISDSDRPEDWRPLDDPVTYQAAMRLAQKMSPSIRTFPGVVIQMDRLADGQWHVNVKLGEKP